MTMASDQRRQSASAAIGLKGTLPETMLPKYTNCPIQSNCRSEDGHQASGS